MVQKQISEAVSREVIIDTLSNLDITIGFLITIGGEPEMLLHSFMTEMLQMHTDVLPQKVTENNY